MAGNDLRQYYFFALKAMADITGTILVPALLVVFLRRLYDQWAYAEIFFYVSLVLAFLLSMWTIVKKVQRYGQEYRKLTDVSGDGRGPRS